MNKKPLIIATIFLITIFIAVYILFLNKPQIPYIEGTAVENSSGVTTDGESGAGIL